MILFLMRNSYYSFCCFLNNENPTKGKIMPNKKQFNLKINLLFLNLFTKIYGTKRRDKNPFDLIKMLINPKKIKGIKNLSIFSGISMVLL